MIKLATFKNKKILSIHEIPLHYAIKSNVIKNLYDILPEEKKNDIIELYNIDDIDFNYLIQFIESNKLILFNDINVILKCIDSANYLNYEVYFDELIQLLAKKINNNEYIEYNNLHEDIKYNLIRYLDFEILNTFKPEISKENKIYLSKYKQYLIRKKFPEIIINNLNDEILFSMKEINIGDKDGYTGYIDFLNSKYFIDTNIVYGYDKYNRFFISILYNMKFTGEERIKKINFFNNMNLNIELI